MCACACANLTSLETVRAAFTAAVSRRFFHFFSVSCGACVCACYATPVRKGSKYGVHEPDMIGESADQLDRELSDPDRGPEGTTALKLPFLPQNSGHAAGNIQVTGCTSSPPKLQLGARDLTGVIHLCVTNWSLTR